MPITPGQRFTLDLPTDLAAAVRKAGVSEGLSYRMVVLMPLKRWLIENGYYRRGASILDPKARHRSRSGTPAAPVDLSYAPPPPGE